MTIWTCIQAMLLITVYFSEKLVHAGTGVTQQLHDVYVTNGSMAEFHCSGYTAHDLFGIVIEDTDYSECSGQLPKNIVCQVSESGEKPSNNIVTLDIIIPAIIANNDTLLVCYFHNIDLNYAGTSGTLYVTTEPPSSPKTLSVAIQSLNMLKITWTEPWYHPDSYILIIRNLTSEDVGYSTINSTSWFMMWNSSDDSCHSLEFTVKAVHSSLGNSSLSESILSGFPKGLSEVNKDSINVDQFLQSDKISVRIDFTFEPPEVCSYQTVWYNFTLVTEIDSSTQTYGPTNAISHEFNNVALSPQYLLMIAVWDEVGLVYFTNKTIDSAFVVVDDPVSSTTTFQTSFTVTSNPNSDAASSPTLSADSEALSTTLLVGLIGGIGAAILLLVCLSVILLVLFLLRTNKRHRQNVAATEDISNGLSTITRLPQVMSANPMYEGFNKDAVYDSITHQNDLKQLPRRSHTFSNNTSSTLLREIPPQVPPPRKMSLDSPGLKSNTQLSYSKRVCGMDPATPDNECCPGFEEYIEMTGGARYVKSPLISGRKLTKKE